VLYDRVVSQRRKVERADEVCDIVSTAGFGVTHGRMSDVQVCHCDILRWVRVCTAGRGWSVDLMVVNVWSLRWGSIGAGACLREGKVYEA
jgi:hypothetical protein